MNTLTDREHKALEAIWIADRTDLPSVKPPFEVKATTDWVLAISTVSVAPSRRGSKGRDTRECVLSDTSCRICSTASDSDIGVRCPNPASHLQHEMLADVA